jgi:hypothetical protein
MSSSVGKGPLNVFDSIESSVDWIRLSSDRSGLRESMEF